MSIFKIKITEDNEPIIKVKSENITDLENAFKTFKKKIKGGK